MIAAAAESEQPVATNTALHFAPGPTEATIQPLPGDADRSPTDLLFHPGAIIDPSVDQFQARPNPLAIASELALLRIENLEQSSDDNDDGDNPSNNAGGASPFGPAGFSLRFEDGARAQALWSRPDRQSQQINRLELLPALYLRSGRVHDRGFESLDYADLYAEVGVGLSMNTGLWLRYERLRQALGQQRQGEQVDADALFLQFELRF